MPNLSDFQSSNKEPLLVQNSTHVFNIIEHQQNNQDYPYYRLSIDYPYTNHIQHMFCFNQQLLQGPHRSQQLIIRQRWHGPGPTLERGPTGGYGIAGDSA